MPSWYTQPRYKGTPHYIVVWNASFHFTLVMVLTKVVPYLYNLAQNKLFTYLVSNKQQAGVSLVAVTWWRTCSDILVCWVGRYLVLGTEHQDTYLVGTFQSACHPVLCWNIFQMIWNWVLWLHCQSYCLNSCKYCPWHILNKFAVNVQLFILVRGRTTCHFCNYCSPGR